VTHEQVSTNNNLYLYNYTRQNPNLNHETQDIIVSPKVDLIRFSICKQKNSNNELNDYFNKLNHVTKYKSKPLKQYKSGYNHSRKYNIMIGGTEFETVLSECMSEPYMPYLWAIHDPKKQILPEVSNHLSLLNHYNVNAVEYVFDFKHHNTIKLYDFLKSTVSLAWRGKSLHLPYETTHYLNNNYMAWSKAGKVYQKTITDECGTEFAVNRVEITLKYNWFKRNKIKSCMDILKVGLKDVGKYISFKKFNYNLFSNKLAELNYGKDFIDELTALFKVDIVNGFLAETNATAKTYCDNRNYLKEHDFNKHFKKHITGSSFWEGEDWYLDSCMMKN